MSTIPMLANIQGQPQSHRDLLAVHRNSQQSTLAQCAATMRKASGNLIFTAMGGSLFASYAAVGRLREHGYAVHLEESSELLHYGVATLRAGDVGVVISRSGESIEPVLLAEKMRHAGMTVIAVTNVPGSKLEKIADLTLHIGAQADKIIAVQTYTGTVLTLLLLAEEAISGTSAPLNDACSAALPALSAHIQRCLQASDDWQPWLTAAPLYLLGRGPALGSVHEGALLLHETAKAAAVGMSSGQFRHGPAEVLSSRFSVVVFGWPSATAALDRSLADDLYIAGAQARWIGPKLGPDKQDDDGRGAPSLAPWPDIDPVLAPLFDIVPLQVAAYRLALWNGVTPGDFRFVTEVTAAESGFLSSTGSRA